MKRWTALAFATALITTATWAGWTAPPGIQGTPVDVTVADAGHLVVASGVATQEFIGTAAGRQIPGAAASGFIDAQGCLAAADLFGAIRGDQSSVPCSYTVQTGLANGVKRLRVGQGGAAYACAAQFPSSIYAYSPNATGAAWSTLTMAPGMCDVPLSVVDVGVTDFALFGTSATASNTPLYREGNLLPAAGTPGATGRPRSVQLVPTPDGRVRAFVVDSLGRLQTSSVSDGGVEGYELLPMPSGITAFQSVAYHLGSAGERFGVAVAQRTDGTYVLLSAVPHPDEAMAGRLWRESTFPIGSLGAQPLGSASQVQCLDAVGCGVITSGSGAGSVLSYVNASPPNAAYAMPSTVLAGGSVSVPLTVSDPDGDAVWVDWVQLSPTTPKLQVGMEDGGVAATITAPAELLCDGGIEATFQLIATDGRTGHVDDGGITTVSMTRGPPIGAPVVAPTQVTLTAGDAPVPIAVSPPAGECTNWPIRWQPDASNGVAMVPLADGGWRVQPPSHFCDPNGATLSFGAILDGPWGPSDAGMLQVDLRPWGAPFAPFGSTEVIQNAGTTATYDRSATHACDDGSTSVPLTTTWWVDGGVPEGVTLTPPIAPGGVVTADSITVENGLACDAGTLVLQARNDVGAQSSPVSSVLIQLLGSRAPDEDAALEITLDPTRLSGDAVVTGVDCMHQRSYTAQFQLEHDGDIVEQTEVPVPGRWSLPQPRPCAPTEYTVRARLNVDGGTSPGPLVWSSPGQAPAVGELVGTGLVAHCGAPASGQLVQHPAVTACDEQVTRWERLAGPELESDSTRGNEITVRTRASGWDGLVGEQVTFRATAVAGADTSAPATITVPIRPSHLFVGARYRTDTPLASEEVPLTLSVDLENTSECAISSATWSEQLEDLRLVDGSVRLDGEPVAARIENGRLVVDGISLEGGARRILSYSVRPALLGRPTPAGQLSIKGEPISERVGLGVAKSPASCGCTSAMPSAWAPAWLAVFVGMVRRRRRRVSQTE